MSTDRPLSRYMQRIADEKKRLPKNQITDSEQFDYWWHRTFADFIRSRMTPKQWQKTLIDFIESDVYNDGPGDWLKIHNFTSYDD